MENNEIIFGLTIVSNDGKKKITDLFNRKSEIKCFDIMSEAVADSYLSDNFNEMEMAHNLADYFRMDSFDYIIGENHAKLLIKAYIQRIQNLTYHMVLADDFIGHDDDIQYHTTPYEEKEDIHIIVEFISILRNAIYALHNPMNKESFTYDEYEEYYKQSLINRREETARIKEEIKNKKVDDDMPF